MQKSWSGNLPLAVGSLISVLNLRTVTIDLGQSWVLWHSDSGATEDMQGTLRALAWSQINFQGGMCRRTASAAADSERCGVPTELELLSGGHQPDKPTTKY